jgi:guanylate kinase
VSRKKGLLVVISSPSGGGKTTVIKKLLEKKDNQYAYSVSVTTRPRRRKEIDGLDYYFVDEVVFRQKIERGEFVEYEKVHDYLYGTLRRPLEDAISKGLVLLLDIDVKGALAIKEQFPRDAALIFLMPPDLETLEERLKNRGSEDQGQLSLRLARIPAELSKAGKFDHVIVNDKLDATLQNVQKVINYRISLI